MVGALRRHPGGADCAVVARDGRLVAFASDATNLVPGDTNGLSDVFRRDLHTGVTVRVSLAVEKIKKAA